MKNSKIEWTDHTWNPWIGCTKVSPGCMHCYAEALMDKRMGRATWGKGQPRSRTSATYWKGPMTWNKEAAASGTRPRVFCASLADWLDDEVPIEWLADLLDLIRKTPNLDWLLLTKRPQNFRERIAGAINHVSTAPSCTDAAFILIDWMQGWQSGNRIPANVWVGTSVEDQVRYEERIGHLCEIPADIRFLSMEPLLGHVDLRLNENLPGQRMLRWHHPVKSMLHWVIVGGESGPHARPMHPHWARSLRDQCKVAGVAFHFKQWGEWAPHLGRTWRLGKKLAGRLLDGVEHNEFPGDTP